MLFADLHLHSKYSRAVSPSMDLEHLAAGAQKKGLGLLGTGDFTHPLWFAELKSKLEEADAGSGIYRLKGGNPAVRFVLQAEISTIISDGTKVRKVHHIVFAPSLESAASLNSLLAKKGNLSADGRPTFGSTSPAALVEICRQADSRIEVVPAHAWTPYFSVFGSISGYDSIEEAYADQARYIKAYETGMSSNPAMNWRVSRLDKYAQISNSDSHSPYPYRIGRECNAFHFGAREPTYEGLFDAMYSHDGSKFAFTIEVDPNYGKYHYDGHRNCKFSCPPGQTRRLAGMCPVCGRPLTIGVLYRVEALADRPEGVKPVGAIPFKTLLPLQELVAAAIGSPLASKKSFEQTERLTARFGTEFAVLLDATHESLQSAAGPELAAVIIANREGKLTVRPGFDGEYGVLELGGGTPKEGLPGKRSTGSAVAAQKGLSDF
ncbi:MAG: endonuclease Q family protein [Candidatus Micrarchaeota archaeon]